MEIFNQFFLELKAHFLEKDLSAYEELKEDIEDSIAAQLAEGKTETEILTALGEPKIIADAFYEDQRLSKAIFAETDVVPIEDIKDEYKHIQKLKKKKILMSLRTFFSSLFSFILLGASVYLLLFFIISFVKEQYIAVGPLLLSFACLSFIALLLSKVKRQRTIATGVFLVTAFATTLLFFTNHWLYQGIKIMETYSLDIDKLNVLKIQADDPIDVSFITISSTEEPRVEINGYIEKHEKNSFLKEHEDTVEISLGNDNHTFDLLKKIPNTELIFYIPQNTSLQQLAFDVEQGDFVSSHLTVKKMEIQANKGDIRLNDVTAETIDFSGKESVFTLNDYTADLTVTNQNGKTILSEGQGKLQILSESALVNIHNIQSSQGTIKNQSGKIVLTDTRINYLQLENKTGTSVLTRQTGELQFDNGSGKIVMEDLGGQMKVANQSGSMIVTEQHAINGRIDNQTGLIKWVQASDSPIQFEVTSPQGTVDNTFKNAKNPTATLEIASKKGDIRIISKTIEGKTKE